MQHDKNNLKQYKKFIKVENNQYLNKSYLKLQNVIDKYNNKSILKQIDT